MESNRINVGIVGLGRWAKVLARAAGPSDLLEPLRIGAGWRNVVSGLSQDLHAALVPGQRSLSVDDVLHHHAYLSWFRPHRQPPHLGARKGEQVVDQALESTDLALHRLQVRSQVGWNHAVALQGGFEVPADGRHGCA